MAATAAFDPIRHGLRDALDPTSVGRPARLFRHGQRVLVAIGLALVLAGSVPDFAVRYEEAVTAGCILVALLFCLEYLLRLQLAVDAGRPPELEGDGRKVFGNGTLRWALSPLGVIDLLAALPLPLMLLAGAEAGNARLFGVLWALKLIRYTAAFNLLGRVLRNEAQSLVGVTVGFVMVLLGAATGVFLLERSVQPDVFGSIPAALWWAITTLTTTGYGDKIPITSAGRVLGGLVMVGGIGLFALWAGILASGFAQELRRRDFLATWDLVARVPLFRSLGAATIAAVARLLRPQELAAGHVVVRKAEPGNCMYFIAAGEVEVRLGAEPVRLGPGGFFGEMALITGEPRVATVVTTKRTTLLRFDVADFRGLTGDHPGLIDTIRSEAARRGSTMAEQVAAPAGAGARGRTS